MRVRSADRRYMIRNSLSNTGFDKEVKKKARCQSAMPARSSFPTLNSSFTNTNNKKLKDDWLKHKAVELVQASDFTKKRDTSRQKFDFDQRITEAREEITDEENRDHCEKKTKSNRAANHNRKSSARNGTFETMAIKAEAQKEDDNDVINFIDNFNLDNFVDKLEEKYHIKDTFVAYSPVEKIYLNNQTQKVASQYIDPNPEESAQNKNNNTDSVPEANYERKARPCVLPNKRFKYGGDKENRSNIAIESRSKAPNHDFKYTTEIRDLKDRESMQTSCVFNRTINEEELEQMTEHQVHKALSSLLFRRNSVG